MGRVAIRRTPNPRIPDMPERNDIRVQDCCTLARTITSELLGPFSFTIIAYEYCLGSLVRLSPRFRTIMTLVARISPLALSVDSTLNWACEADTDTAPKKYL